ncbi:uncharacterized protein LOC116405030 [Cucumis sativus]|uniref:uncharacterized protein LOC116405030 n=1 Tax=Cucumis sativus TaxID=3659 RepID=UPI0012F485AF|nr:uncharacterized protein LOC116405030 [Cucumis sativus]
MTKIPSFIFLPLFFFFLFFFFLFFNPKTEGRSKEKHKPEHLNSPASAVTPFNSLPPPVNVFLFRPFLLHFHPFLLHDSPLYFPISTCSRNVSISSARVSVLLSTSSPADASPLPSISISGFSMASTSTNGPMYKIDPAHHFQSIVSSLSHLVSRLTMLSDQNKTVKILG